MTEPVDLVCGRLEALGLDCRRNGAGYRSQCPGHDDTLPSLSIKEAEDGRVLLHCFAGCSLGQILDPLSLRKSDLFPPRLRIAPETAGRSDSFGNSRPQPKPKRSPSATPEPLPAPDKIEAWIRALHESSDALALARQRKGWTPEVMQAAGVGWDGQRFTLPIRDQSGELINVCRYQPDGKPKLLAARGRTRDLFPAPEMVPDGGDLWLVEGEPDAISARAIGLQAIGVPGVSWAGKLADHRDRFRKFERVLVLMDCDGPGRKAAALAGAALASVVEVRILDLDLNRDDGRDVGDE